MVPATRGTEKSVEQPTGVAAPLRPLEKLAPDQDFDDERWNGFVRYALYLGAGIEDAEDLVQGAIASYLERVPMGQVKKRDAWIRRAIYHDLVDQRRRERTRYVGDDTYSRLTYGDETVGEREMNVWEDRQWALSLLRRLPPTQQAVLALIFDELTPAEIGELLGKSAAAVRKNLQLACERLRAILANESG